jgi:single-stranded DNA-binding protein
MDLNLVVLAGRIAAEPEIRTFESGATLMRLLVTVRSEEPRHRLDVIPVVQWNPDSDGITDGPVRGRSVWVAGAVQRRFWSVGDGRESRIEIVAHEITIRDEESSFTDNAATAS